MQNERKGRKWLWFGAAAVIIIGIAAAVWLFSVYRKNRDVQTAEGIILDDGAENWDGEMEDLSQDQPGIKIPGYGYITVMSGETAWKITLANPKENNCYFQYSITIDENENPIYESDLIEPGKAVREFEVNEPLEAGDYEIHLNISTYTMDDGLTPLNGAVVKAVLHVV